MIKKYSNWLIERKLKIIDKEGKQSISDKVKSRKFFNHLPQYMEETVIPLNSEQRTHEQQVQQTESHKASKEHIAVLINMRGTAQQTTTKSHNLDHYRLSNG